MIDEDVFFLSAGELAACIRRREVSPVELVDALFERIHAVDRSINAYCTLADDSARAAARHAEKLLLAGESVGPLLGVPVSLKDNIETAGIRTTYGSRVFEHFVPVDDAICVSRLSAAGAIVVGKTSTPEFAAKGVVDPPLFGHTRNPWALDRTVGGSSGGAAAAVAAGMGPLALGNDFGGSVRIPASFNGVAGFKPTAGRVAFHPKDNPWDTLAQVGPISRSVDDLDLALRVLEGPDPRDPVSLPSLGEDWKRSLETLIRPWRLAWSPDLGFAQPDAEVVGICLEAFEHLAEAGFGATPRVDLSDAPEAADALMSIHRGAVFADVIDEWEPMMDPFVAARVKRGLDFGVPDLGRGNARRSSLYAAIEACFAEFDLLVTPAVAIEPFEIGLDNPQTVDGGEPFPFSYPFNLTGHPAVAVPAGWTASGLPVGVQIVGRRFADREVLAAARQLERVRPWADRRPLAAIQPSRALDVEPIGVESFAP